MTETPQAERFDAEYFQDPLAHFARLREDRPVTPVILPDGARVWLVTRYADVRAALADLRLSKDVRKLAKDGWTPNPIFGRLRAHMLNLDPPDHTRLRRLVSKAFTTRRIASLRPRVEAITASLADGIEGRDEADLVASFALPLPVTVICELLGVPAADQDSFAAWSRTLLSSVASREEYQEAGAAMFGYFTQLLGAKRQSPSDDLLSALIAARDDDEDSLSEHELIAMGFLLLIAGHETTVNLIASGMLALLTHPAELARLRSDPSLLPAAVEELLRYANPLNHATNRFTTAPTEIGGIVIPEQEWVVCVTSSANHDPARFAEPGRLDIGRDASGHLAFGYGIHYCLGAPLARLEGEAAFGALLARFPGMTLAVPETSLRWRLSSLIHGLEELPVRLR